jgi:hypothetical protein
MQEKLNQETLIQKNQIISTWFCPGPQKNGRKYILLYAICLMEDEYS